MPDTTEPLVRDFVEWVAKESRPYSEVLEGWRTSCPRQTVLEDASDRGYIERRRVEGKGIFVVVTDLGREFVAAGYR